MTPYRTMLTAASLIAMVHAGTAAAQNGSSGSTPGEADAPATGNAAPTEVDDAIVVTGTRVAGRSRLETASPVDVLSGAALRRQGSTELAQTLANVAPSIDFPRPSANDATDAIRPVTLRGLSPDQTLVLVNGVRGHTSASLNVNGAIGRGSAAFDLNTIPVVALETVEVLRDGASAQYGSDAIAGVVNLRLREARSGGGASVQYGFYHTDVNTANGSRSVTGEHTLNATAWQGIGFGNDGYVTVSGEYQRRLPTSRGDFDLRPSATQGTVNNRYGDPDVKQYTGFVNAGTGLGDTFKLYGWFGYQYRDTTSAAFPRLSTTAAANGLATLYPNGFLPLINTRSKDINSAVGIKGEIEGWSVDANVSYGRNRVDFRTLNSANYTYRGTTPTNFYDGALIYDQVVGGIDVARKFDVFESLNVAFGIEGRRESYEIKAGEFASSGRSPVAFTATPGAQGFGGFSPGNQISRHRENGSIYLDLEAQVTPKLLVGLAGRGEDYSDFGTTGTGKVSARYDFSPAFALRGTASTGFRAPSLQQQYFTSTASVIVNSVPVLTGTFPSVNPVAAALGGRALEPEKSTNLSVGTVIRIGGLDLTVDAYRIHIRNQIGLSENLAAAGNPAVAALLAPFGVSAARFFINGIASTSRGIDAVAHYRLRSDRAGTFDFTVAGNVNDIDVTRVPTTTSTLNPAPTLFARSRILTLESGTPGEKVSGTLDWSLHDIGATTRITYYGNVLQPATTPTILVNGVALTNDVQTGKRALVDLEARYQPVAGAQIAIGVSNLLDTYPRRIPAYLNSTGVTSYSFNSPFGFNGRFLYARAGLSW